MIAEFTTVDERCPVVLKQDAGVDALAAVEPTLGARFLFTAAEGAGVQAGTITSISDDEVTIRVQGPRRSTVATVARERLNGLAPSPLQGLRLGTCMRVLCPNDDGTRQWVYGPLTKVMPGAEVIQVFSQYDGQVCTCPTYDAQFATTGEWLVDVSSSVEPQS